MMALHGIPVSDYNWFENFILVLHMLFLHITIFNELQVVSAISQYLQA